MPPTLPRLHANGTPAKMLAKSYSEAWAALDAARDVMRQAAPNGRDYDSHEDFALAAADHRNRIWRIDAVMDELDTLIGHCS